MFAANIDSKDEHSQLYKFEGIIKGIVELASRTLIHYKSFFGGPISTSIVFVRSNLLYTEIKKLNKSVQKGRSESKNMNDQNYFRKVVICHVDLLFGC